MDRVAWYASLRAHVRPAILGYERRGLLIGQKHVRFLGVRIRRKDASTVEGTRVTATVRCGSSFSCRSAARGRHSLTTI